MFLLRSAFWLTAAYMVIAPASADFGAQAENAGAEIMRGGQTLLASGLENAPACESFECAAGRAILLSAVSHAVPAPIETPTSAAPQTIAALIAAEPDAGFAPVPPRRPDWAG